MEGVNPSCLPTKLMFRNLQGIKICTIFGGYLYNASFAHSIGGTNIPQDLTVPFFSFFGFHCSLNIANIDNLRMFGSSV
jgi:hypothetical protein